MSKSSWIASSKFELDTYHSVDNHGKETMIQRKVNELLRQQLPISSRLMPSALSGSPGVLGEPCCCPGHASIGAHSQPALLATEPISIGPETDSIPRPRFLFGYSTRDIETETDTANLPKLRSGCRPMESKVPHPELLVGGRDKLRDSHGPHDDSHAAIYY